MGFCFLCFNPFCGGNCNYIIDDTEFIEEPKPDFIAPDKVSCSILMKDLVNRSIEGYNLEELRYRNGLVIALRLKRSEHEAEAYRNHMLNKLKEKQ